MKLITAIIRENKLPQLANAILTGKNVGMVPMDEVIKDYYQKGIITYDTAYTNARDRKSIQK